MPYLTKSRFKEAIECPDRMFYYGKKKEFADDRHEDEFLAELAKTGIQVGELAKCYFPEGTEVTAIKNDEAVAQTAELLKKDNVIIFEAALSSGNLLVRVDVLVKKGGRIDLYEVKSKSIFEEGEIYTKKGIASDWKEYVYDIAFQMHVAKLGLPGYELHGHLMLIDKQSICSVDGLYQKFRLRKIDGRYKATADPAIPVGDPILKSFELTPAIEKIIAGQESIDEKLYGFKDYVQLLSDAAGSDKMIGVRTGRHCKSCPFVASAENKAKGLKSGYEECWRAKESFKDEDFLKPHVFDIWRLHFMKLEGFLDTKRRFLSELKKEDFSGSSAWRQWLQVERALNPGLGSYIDKEGLKAEFSKLKPPFHFIDFEVAMNGIPYKKGLGPYHRFAFQFSHHLMKEDGSVSHAGQWLETTIGKDPNIEFVRRLKQELSGDNGSILIYSQYENSILLFLYDVVRASGEADKEELLAFIKSITRSEKEGASWTGERLMVDMLKWVVDYYLSPHMKGSNSIKVVLPAILEESKFLKNKYGKNLVVAGEDGKIVDPYKLLPPIFDGLKREEIEFLFEEEDLADGGAAMCAYNLMQFMDMSDQERTAIISALYKYCELDTLAMVMIFEGLSEMANSK